MKSAEQTSRSCATYPGRPSDAVRRERHLLRSARDSHLLPDVPPVLAQHSQRQRVDRRRTGVLCSTRGLFSRRPAARVGRLAHQGAEHTASAAADLVNAGHDSREGEICATHRTDRGQAV